MTVVGTWTGQQAADLRAALRMPITEFAAYLGIAEGTVSKWERKLTAVVPTPDTTPVEALRTPAGLVLKTGPEPTGTPVPEGATLVTTPGR